MNLRLRLVKQMKKTESKFDSTSVMIKQQTYNMTRIAILMITFLLTLISCKKEKFPENDNVIGIWTEQTELYYKHKIVFENETMIFIKQGSVDTFAYQLDQKTKLLILIIKNRSFAGKSNHQIFFNKRNKTLTIFGLFPSNINTSETIFKKE